MSGRGGEGVGTLSVQKLPGWGGGRVPPLPEFTPEEDCDQTAVFVLQLIDGKFSKEVSHETDGLIFQPAADVSGSHGNQCQSSPVSMGSDPFPWKQTCVAMAGSREKNTE